MPLLTTTKEEQERIQKSYPKYKPNTVYKIFIADEPPNNWRGAGTIFLILKYAVYHEFYQYDGCSIVLVAQASIKVTTEHPEGTYWSSEYLEAHPHNSEYGLNCEYQENEIEIVEESEGDKLLSDEERLRKCIDKSQIILEKHKFTERGFSPSKFISVCKMFAKKHNVNLEDVIIDDNVQLKIRTELKEYRNGTETNNRAEDIR